MYDLLVFDRQRLDAGPDQRGLFTKLGGFVWGTIASVHLSKGVFERSSVSLGEG